MPASRTKHALTSTIASQADTINFGCGPLGLLSKSEDGHEGLVDAPLLFGGDVTYQSTKPTGVDGSHLLNEYPVVAPSRSTSGRNARGPRAQ